AHFGLAAVGNRSDDWWCKGETMLDRKSTRLNSSHGSISYAVFCLKKKKKKKNDDICIRKTNNTKQSERTREVKKEYDHVNEQGDAVTTGCERNSGVTMPLRGTSSA